MKSRNRLRLTGILAVALGIAASTASILGLKSNLGISLFFLFIGIFAVVLGINLLIRLTLKKH